MGSVRGAGRSMQSLCVFADRHSICASEIISKNQSAVNGLSRVPFWLSSVTFGERLVPNFEALHLQKF